MSLIRTMGKAAIAKGIQKHGARKGLLGFGIGMVATRIATRSIPGALLVGGAFLAKSLYDKKKANEQKE